MNTRNGLERIIVGSPVGDLIISATEVGICSIQFTTENELEKYAWESKNEILLLAKKELSDYFEGILQIFTVPLDLRGTNFQKLVWKELLTIPYGKTYSYYQQALSIENVKAIRAVANANARNPVPIIVPCHRVIGSNGKLTGYAGGLLRKKYLLELEQGSAQIFPLL